MKNKTLRIEIPIPCQENWEAMTPTEQGKLCEACAKEVIDFSTYSDQQLIRFFEQEKSDDLCGRYRRDQVNTTLQNRPLYQMVPRLSLVMAGLFGLTLAQGQSPVNLSTEQPATHLLELMNNQEIHLLKGTVLEQSPGQPPLAGASVALVNRGVLIDGTVTLDGGHFELKVPAHILEEEGYLLEISYVGFERQQFPLQEIPTRPILLKPGINLESVVIVGRMVYVVDGLMMGLSVARGEIQQEEAEEEAEALTETCTRSLVYPNPFFDQLNVQLEMEEAMQIQLFLVDMSGRQLYHRFEQVPAGPITIQLNLGQLPLAQGHYLLNIQSSEALIHSQVVIRGTESGMPGHALPAKN